jgi:hypothetical protein
MDSSSTVPCGARGFHVIRNTPTAAMRRAKADSGRKIQLIVCACCGVQRGVS